MLPPIMSDKTCWSPNAPLLYGSKDSILPPAAVVITSSYHDLCRKWRDAVLAAIQQGSMWRPAGFLSYIVCRMFSWNHPKFSLIDTQPANTPDCTTYPGYFLCASNNCTQHTRNCPWGGFDGEHADHNINNELLRLLWQQASWQTMHLRTKRKEVRGDVKGAVWQAL